MMRGRVIGELWGTRKAAGLDGRKLVLVVELHGAVVTDHVVVAWDTIDGKLGQDVLVSFGSGARNAVQPGDDRDLVCDAALGLLVDDPDGHGGVGKGAA